MKFDKDVSTFCKSEFSNYGNPVMMRMHNRFLIYGYLITCQQNGFLYFSELTLFRVLLDC